MRAKAGKSGRLKRASEKEALKRKQDLRKRRAELIPEARICVQGDAYPGVVVRFGTRQLKLDESRRGVRFRVDPDSEGILMETIET